MQSKSKFLETGKKKKDMQPWRKSTQYQGTKDWTDPS